MIRQDRWLSTLLVAATLVATRAPAQRTTPQPVAATAPKVADPRVERLKAEALTKIEGRAKQIQEMVDMVSASRAYQANVAAMNATRDLIRNALALG